MIFDWILHSDVQYNFWENTILRCIVWFSIYTTLGRTVRFLREYYTRMYIMIFDSYCSRTYSMILNLCCTRKYSMVFEFILHSDIQYDLWLNTIVGRIEWFLIEHYTRTYSMIFDFILHSDVQYDFWENTILERILWFLIYTVLRRTVWFWIYTTFGRTVWFLNLYCTRTYSMIFDWILYSNV